jgi:hypothetical protein
LILKSILLGIHLSKIGGEAARNNKLEVHMSDLRGGTIIFTPAVIVAEKDRELK